MNQYGNRVSSTDEYGNPIHGHAHETGAAAYGQHAIGGAGQQQLHGGGVPAAEMKKGIKDKIKEKLPAGGRKAEQTPQFPSEGVHAHEKKGVIEKIKEKLPGHHTN